MSTFAWEKVICPKRLDFDGKQYEDDDGTPKLPIAHKDHERIITSSSFRRLQGKTQVYPFPQNDFVRNRLTHTIEVAHIGRTIALLISERLNLDAKMRISVPQLAVNGCLLHDIGNPPFGHSGESSIREFFEANEDGISLITNAFKKTEYKNDFIFFDGNAQGFRVVTRLSGWKQNGGLRLSASTLTSMIKYAFPSSSESAKKGKFGYMDSEKDYAEKIFDECGLSLNNILYRSPISLIVEAADDIAYLTSDVQDAFNNEDIDYDSAFRLLSNLSSEEDKVYIMDMYNDQNIPRDHVISSVRSTAVSFMTKAATEILYKNIFKSRTQTEGTRKFDVWDIKNIPDSFDAISSDGMAIRNASKSLIYRGKRKLSLQVGGGRIIKFVLSMQLKALEEINKSVFEVVMAYPEIHEKLKKEEYIGFSLERYIKIIIDNIDEFVSRESAQIFWGMPLDSHDAYKDILIDAKYKNLKIDDPCISYRIIQISVDFVSGTTDKYLSNYSKNWSGPCINE